MALADEKYVSFTTFRKSGAAVSTPTWIIPLDNGKLGFWTSSKSGKAKRISNDSHVTLQPSDARGRVKPDAGAAVHADASIVTSGAEFDAIQQKVRAKYGVMVPISRLLNTIGHLGKGGFPYGDL